MLEAGVGQCLVRLEEFLLVLFFAALDARTAVGPARDRRLRFDRQPVKREMIRSQLQSLIEIASPRPIEMARQGEDQIDRNVGYAAAPEHFDRSAYLLGCMGAVHPFQRGSIKGLRAK